MWFRRADGVSTFARIMKCLNDYTGASREVWTPSSHRVSNCFQTSRGAPWDQAECDEVNGDNGKFCCSPKPRPLILLMMRSLTKMCGLPCLPLSDVVLLVYSARLHWCYVSCLLVTIAGAGAHCHRRSKTKTLHFLCALYVEIPMLLQCRTLHFLCFQFRLLWV